MAGVSDEDINLIEALQNCSEAVATAEGLDSARLMFQTGRVLWLAEEFEEAMPFLLDAAEAGEPAAMAYLGDAYANGLGGAEEDRETALAFYTQAAAAGFLPADAMADELAAEMTETSMPEVQIATRTAQEVNECDRLAAHPADPRKNSPGVTDTVLDISKAVLVCAAATAKFPGIARLDYQYGRSLYLAGQQGEALPLLANAAEKGHAASKALLGDIFLEGTGGQQQDLGAAYAFYKEAAVGGYLPAAQLAKELEASFGTSQAAGSSKLKLDCEATLTRTDQFFEPLEYKNAKFSFDLDFNTSMMRTTGDEIPAIGQKPIFNFNKDYSFSVDESTNRLSVNAEDLGPSVPDNVTNINFDDGKFYFRQVYQVGTLLGYPLLNALFLDGYCGERATAAKPKPVATKPKSKKKT